MGESTKTTRSTSGPTSPVVNDSLDKLAGAFGGQVGLPANPYGQSLYVPISGTTRSGIDDTISAANAGQGGLGSAFGYAQNVVGNEGYNDALRRAETGIGGYLAESAMDAPGYERLRSRVADDTLTDVNSIFSASGRLGSDKHVGTATESLADSLAGLDYQNYTDRLGRQLAGNSALAGIGQTAMGNAMGAANSIPSLYQATQLPALDKLRAGAILDADANAARGAAFDLHERTSNAELDRLLKISAGMSGTAGAAGQTSTLTEPATPWWQTLLGTGLGVGAMFL